jgi:hypothetical protein
MVVEIAYSELSIMSCNYFVYLALDLILAQNKALQPEGTHAFLSVN